MTSKPKINGHTETCGNCRYWKRMQPERPQGMCRKRPPTMLLLGMAPHPMNPKQQMPITDSFWPPIPETEWCGKWALANRAAIQVQPTPIVLDLPKLREALS